jgi:signal transduction histidine kinase
MPKTGSDTEQKEVSRDVFSKSGRIPPEEIDHLYKRHVQGAYVWTGAVISLWSFFLFFYLFDAIDAASFLGLSVTALIALFVYIPFLRGLKRIAHKGRLEAYNLLINFIQAIGDTVMIYFLGGVRGMYLILIYACLIAYIGVVAPIRYPFIIATVCAGTFGLMALLEHFGVIPHQNGHWEYYFTLTEVIMFIIILTVTLYVLAFILSYTSNLLKKTREALRVHNAELGASREKLDRIASQLRQKNIELEKSMNGLRQAQAQLVEAEKLAALGGLVAGVAHEINTPVGIGVTAVSFLQEKAEQMLEALHAKGLETDAVDHFVRNVSEASATIHTNLKRAAELVRHFKQVAVDQSTETRRKFNLKEYIDGTLLSMRFQYKRTGHTITVNCPPDLVIDSYPGAFSQIITNLLMNSLTHGLEGVEKGQILFDVFLDSRQIYFKYSDNGNGMEEKIRNRIFEPFFTTKRGGGGTGLGMYIVYNIVTRTLGGTIRCVSAPEKGTLFDIRIPVSQAS